jgi:predicted nucleic acid-binding protein
MELIEGRFGQLVRCEEADWREALALIEKYPEQRLSFADGTSVAIIRRMNIERIASFDRHFAIIVTERPVINE